MLVAEVTSESLGRDMPSGLRESMLRDSAREPHVGSAREHTLRAQELVLSFEEGDALLAL